MGPGEPGREDRRWAGERSRADELGRGEYLGRSIRLAGTRASECGCCHLGTSLRLVPVADKRRGSASRKVGDRQGKASRVKSPATRRPAPPDLPASQGHPKEEQPGPRARQGARTRKRLLDSAMAVFGEKGYHATRVDDIVAHAKTSHGTFYLYFANKEDLLRALVAEAAKEVVALDELLGPLVPGEAGWAQLRAWIARFSHAWQHYAPVVQVLPDLLLTDTDLSVQAQLAIDDLSANLAGRLAEASSDDRLDPKAAAEAIIAMIDRVHYVREFTGQPLDDTAIDTLTTMVYRIALSGPIP